MEREARTAAFSAIGAVIGAGFASGREIDSFFSRYGGWSYLGVGGAVGAILLIALGVMRRPGLSGMPERWQGRRMAWVWRGMFSALLISTGGAMLAAGGEIAALMLPVRGAYGLGLAGTAAITVLLARRGGGAGAWVSGLTAGMLACLAAAGFALTPQRAAVMDAGSAGESLLRGVSYAGFNMALAAPGLATAAGRMTGRGKRQCALLTALILGVLLAGGNALLMRHSALRGEAMPFIRLLSAYGKTGYYLGGAAMYLAVLTSACAALRGLWVTLPEGRRTRAMALMGMLLCAGLGFSGVVERVYPLLGAGCLGLMTAALLSRR